MRSPLMTVQPVAQGVAEAMAAALGLEFEIVDDTLTIVAGTGKYRDWVGRREEDGDPGSGFLYGRALRSGQVLVVEDPAGDPAYDPRSLRGETDEQAEICGPIILNGRAIGVAGLIALDEGQRRILLGKRQVMTEFLNRVTDLLAKAVALNHAAHRPVSPDGLPGRPDAGWKMFEFSDIKGTSPAIERAKGLALRAAAGDATVLLFGESGTGKEMFAQAIHRAGRRASGPFVVINCGAIPENLLESEVFGYEGGAFTGARREGKAGKFELAHGGTLFLDEVGELSPPLQGKLLRFLQDRVVERVGGTRPRRVDVRILAATNQDLERLIRQRKFREDLYYRMNVIPIAIPPLRARGGDVIALAEYLLEQHRWPAASAAVGFTGRAIELLRAHSWPGNVRELENAVQYALHVGQGALLDGDSLPPHIRRLSTRASGSLHQQLRRFEAEILDAHLERHGRGARALEAAARELGISRASLYRKLRLIRKPVPGDGPAIGEG
ncbi:MAG TPA: sigma 54-interacting transcriptional regulator [Bacillota bacterium]|nr:sigma 54-interacting transcriptional regulator [Bacillota bacterium]